MVWIEAEESVKSVLVVEMDCVEGHEELLMEFPLRTVEGRETGSRTGAG